MYQKYFKRLFDILGTLILFPFLLILILFVGLAIKIEDRGPIIYVAKRLGKNGKLFKMYKFRSMKVNALDIRNKDGSTFNSENDPRLTRIGKIIRKVSIDEMPQILNVLKGDMSFIGPRPDLPEDIYLYSIEQKSRLSILPGITGYSQAFYRNSIENEEKWANDVFYSKNISILLDIKIFIKTLATVFTQKNIFYNDKNLNS